MVNYANLEHAKLAYQIFGNGKVDVVIELALGACMGEWIHIAERISLTNTVLLYERAGVASSTESSINRTPENIASELYSLLQTIPHEKSIIIIAHSQGGLYAQQFARSYPEITRALILLDPLSANDNSFKTLLTPEELNKSGVDKFSNLGILEKLAKLHLGFLIKAMMKSAPPFYYYREFSDDAKEYILASLTKPLTFRTAIKEYQFAHDENKIASLKSSEGFPNIPLVLITHTSELAIKEIMEFGRASQEQANKVENIWQCLMKEHLVFSKKSQFIQASHSSHYIHLSEPELVLDALKQCSF